MAPQGSMVGTPAERTAPRDRLAESMFLACGELGYRNVEPSRIYGADELARFEARYEGKRECFSAGYAGEADRISALFRIAPSDPRRRRRELERALLSVGERIETCESAARAFLIEVHLVGGPVRGERRELLASIGRALDVAYRRPEPARAVPAATGLFIAATIEQVLAQAWEADTPTAFTAAIPELAGMVDAAYA